MDFRATKDRHEREQEEAERLVRPAPKVKAPRKDLRREEMRPDRDPDIDEDPDIAKDKDLSLNYKTIGGSVATRVAERYLYGHDPTALRVAVRFIEADLDRSDYVAVVNKETGESTHIKPDTLKGPEGSKYKVIQEEEKKGPSSEDSVKVLELAQKEPRLKGVLDTLADPKHKEHTTLTSLTHLPVGALLKGVDFPPSIKTVGDLLAVAQAQGASKKKPKKEKASPKAPEPDAKAPRAPPEKKPEAPPEDEKKPESSAEEKAPSAGEKTEAPASERAAPETSATPPSYEPEEYGGPSKDERAALQSWVAEKGLESPDFKAWADKQKTIGEKDGKLLFKTKGKSRVPFEELSPADQHTIKRKYEQDTKIERNAEALKKFSEDPAAQKTLQDLANPESDLRKKIEQEAREAGHDLSEADIVKTIPALKNIKLPDTFSSAQDVIDASEKILGRPPEPKRAPANKQEEQRAETAIEEILPEEFREHIEGMRLHPDQVNSLLSAYKSAMNVDVPEDHVLSSAGFELDPERIDPPTHAYVNGKRTAFADLNPEQKSIIYDRHKMHVLATSMAAKKRLENKFAFTGLPAGPAKVIAETVIQSKGKGLSDETVQNFFRSSLATSFASKPLKDNEVKELFNAVKDNPAAKKLVAAYVQASSYAQARDEFLSPSAHGPNRITEYDDPSKIAKKLQKASEFLKEKTKNLPADAVVVDPAMAFRNRVMDRMSYLAPERVPYIRKYLEDYENKEYETRKAQTDKLTKQFNKALQDEAKIRQKELGSTPHTLYREMANQEEDDLEARLAKRGIFRPKPPAAPPGYDAWKNRNEVEESAKRSFEWLQNLFGRGPKGKERKELEEGRKKRLEEEARLTEEEEPTPKTKKAALTVEERVLLRTLVPSTRQRLAFRAEMGLLGSSYSSYSSCWTMGDSSSGVRTAVYWGQEPYVDTQPYPGWSQLHARDFDNADFDQILKAAREWLKMPVLSWQIRGLYPDTQLRAALDLAIRDHENGKYSVGLYPTVYNELLARLSSRPGPYELLTGKPDDVPVAGVKSAGKSIYGDTTERGSTTMKASAQVRSFAARAASGTPDPELAFDLAALADRMAAEEMQGGQEQAGQQQGQAPAEQQKQAAIRIAANTQNKFNAVKAIVVKQATTYPTLREVFLPILQALKG